MLTLSPYGSRKSCLTCSTCSKGHFRKIIMSSVYTKTKLPAFRAEDNVRCSLKRRGCSHWFKRHASISPKPMMKCEVFPFAILFINFKEAVLRTKLQYGKHVASTNLSIPLFITGRELGSSLVMAFFSIVNVKEK